MHPVEVHLLSKASQNSHVKWTIDAAQIFTNHLLGQAFPCDEKSGNGSRRILQEASLNQINDAFVWLLVEYIESGSIMPFANDFINGVHVGDQVIAGSSHH